jgi:hypothetical protein
MVTDKLHYCTVGKQGQYYVHYFIPSFNSWRWLSHKSHSEMVSIPSLTLSAMEEDAIEVCVT